VGIGAKYNPLVFFERRLEKPFSDPAGKKGLWGWIARAPQHTIQRVPVAIAGWPRFSRALRIVFMADLHIGSHTGDVARLASLIETAKHLEPDVLCLGGDYLNGMPFGGGRVPPNTVAAILANVSPPLGRFGVLGDHDNTYGADEVSAALSSAEVVVLNNQTQHILFDGEAIAVIGVTPDADQLEKLLPSRGAMPAIILAHDPAAFAKVPVGPYIMLSGHTHGGQIQLPLIGPIINASAAPLRWTYGHVAEGGRHLYVTSGIGTSAFPLRLGIAPEIVLLEVIGDHRP
jgi:uncharacterized protein